MIVVLNKPGSVNKNIIKIDSYDTWNVDVTLSKIIAPLLKEFKSKTHSYPHTIDQSDLPSELYREDAPEENWNHVLDIMIWSFEQISNSQREDAFVNFDVNGNILGVDEEAYNLYEDKIRSGTKLFGKYFQSLWD